MLNATMLPDAMPVIRVLGAGRESKVEEQQVKKEMLHTHKSSQLYMPGGSSGDHQGAPKTPYNQVKVFPILYCVKLELD